MDGEDGFGCECGLGKDRYGLGEALGWRERRWFDAGRRREFEVDEVREASE